MGEKRKEMRGKERKKYLRKKKGNFPKGKELSKKRKRKMISRY